MLTRARGGSPDLGHWELAAVDFHCSNILERSAAQGLFAGHGPDAQRAMMWRYGSAVSRKHAAPFSAPLPADPPDAGTEQAWRDAEPQLHAIARSILSQRR